MDYQYLLQFLIAKGTSDKLLRQAIDFLENNPGWSWEDLTTSYNVLTSKLHVNEEIAQNIIDSREKALIIQEKLYERNIKLILESNPFYPNKLRATLGTHTPPVLFVEGNAKLLDSKYSVGFCGSRKVSNKGLSITENCAAQLVKQDITVVSGYAAGTDLAAHKSALKHGGKTIFVLAEGILRKNNKNEISDYLKNNNYVFVSQFAPELTWNVGNAMKRNKTIIGLSDVMILVESGKEGGTFEAGEETLKVGHPLFVIDFAKPEVSAEANPYFISKGGIPIRGNKEGIPTLKNVLSLVKEPNKKLYTNL